MADRVSASIKLGGTLPRAKLGELLKVIAAEGLSTEWDGEPFSADQIPAEAPLELFAHQVAGGSFDQLESFCVSHALPFMRWCDGYTGGWSPERLVFGGTGEPRSYSVNESDQVVIGRTEIRLLGSLEAIEAHFASAEMAVPPLTLVERRNPMAKVSPEPTMDMWRALIAFRTRYGRIWKSALAMRWMNGTDENEPLGASLRELRNHFGPSWLHALRRRALDEAERRIALLDRLPVMCATRNLDTGEAIILKRGESGYWTLPEGFTIDSFNAALAPTPSQIAAMEIGSAFGWDVPGADPLNYDAEGRPLASERRREGG